jgi:hypothetical protein
MKNLILYIFYSFMASLAFIQNAKAQSPYFVYLQTENNRPFYVQFNKKNISSSSVGHLILPQLAPGTYDIVVGFAGENTRQEYQLIVKDRDLGFLIKGFDGGSRYGLLNLQTGEVQLSGSAKEAALAEQRRQQEALAAEKQRQEEALLAEQKRRQDEATKLAEQQKQTAEAQKQIEAEANRKSEEAAQKATTEKNTATLLPAAPPTATDTDIQAAELKRKQEEEIKRYNAERLAALKKQEQEAEAKKLAEKAAENNSREKEKVLSAAEILRLQEEARRIDARGKRDSLLKATAPATNNKGSQPKFLDIDFTMPDSSNPSMPLTPLVPADTVAIPVTDTIIVSKYSLDSAKVEAPVDSKTDSAKAQLLEVTQTAFTPQEAKPEIATAQAADSTVAKAAEPIATVGVDTLPNQPAATKAALDTSHAAPLADGNCKAEATSGDIELMLMLIKAESDPENALDLVKKMVRIKCVSTVQIRKLAGLFSTDEARYQLLDMCYKYTIDRKQYGVLANLLTDVYYINRFKALVQ